MNNILLDNNKIYVKDEKNVVELNDLNKDYNIVVREKVKVSLTIISNNSNLSFSIKLEKDSQLFLQVFTTNGSINIDTELLQNSEFKLNNSVLNNEDSINKIKIKHLEDRSVSNIKNHGFSINGAKLVFNIDGIIIKEANKCIHHQDNQIIENENSFSTILPKLYIDNYDIDATHSAYVGEFKEKDLFYLQSRGISLENSKFLLLNAFLLGYLQLSDEYKSKLYEHILNYINKEV